MDERRSLAGDHITRATEGSLHINRRAFPTSRLTALALSNCETNGRAAELELTWNLAADADAPEVSFCLNPSHRRISSLELFADDTTANIDYTRALDQPLTGIKPGRRSMMGVGRAKKAAPVTVFEDVQENEELVLGDNRQKAVQGKTLLSKPAQKLAMAGAPVRPMGGRRESMTGGAVGSIGGRRESVMGGDLGVGKASSDLNANGSLAGMRAERSVTYAAEKERNETLGIAKKPRRATIYIPEDTTVMTIHPGVDNTSRLDDTFHLPAAQPSRHMMISENQRPGKQLQARRPRQSLAALPKRLPLRESSSTENMPGWDVAGCNTGKENVPPGAVDQVEKNMKSLGLAEKQPTARRPRSSLMESIAESRRRASLMPRPYARPDVEQLQEPILKTKVSFNFVRNRPDGVPRRTVTTEASYEVPRRQSVMPVKKLGALPSPVVRSVPHKEPTPPKPKPVKLAEEEQQIRNFIATKRNEQHAAKVKEYPVLSGDLSQPELYENEWLANQEIALTEIATEIFTMSTPVSQHALDGSALREKLIEIYNQPETALLHRRIQASLEYGALSPPQDSFSTRNPSLDIGLRKRLIGLWLDNYDDSVLRIAAEVVAGRRIPATDGDHDSTLDSHVGRRALNSFLELFFVCIGDVAYMPGHNINGDVDAIRWRKMMSRGLMLIQLLDEAKTSGFFKGCLFKRGSTKKSSVEVLNAFAALLLPSVGDIGRSLKHMGYEVAQVQDPLDEVVYRIENLAVDLRDGIRLTRLVEVLLCSRESRGRSRKGLDDTLAVRMPDETVLLTSLGTSTPDTPALRPLSKYLKVPCLSAAEKKYNIQVALSALESHSIEGINVVGDITAKDILDGHREKTLSLMWQLVSAFGLEHLLDWRELYNDIVQCTGRAQTVSQLNEVLSATDGHNLLQEWASGYAVRAGLAPINNLTTAFTDGKVYTAILSAFAACTSEDEKQFAVLGSSKTSENIRAQLSALRFSKAFSNQIVASIGTFPSRETTISNLALLASRLLPLSRRYNAAVTIQRALRKRLERNEIFRRIKFLRLAFKAEEEQRLLNAVLFVQRTWQKKRNARVEPFQSLARGWLSRGLGGGRLMGGW
ncbi:Protein abnormal spindle [Pseudocercospora fuligena]|uniref:Protein abnormal spindle n=1 Tax=Pseudocercospora fuligena TaxID=685502 RepID=A0A8H6RI20_9PEZI|nr:Protein abnormal spindle [Pseudocercospora fuligena]